MAGVPSWHPLVKWMERLEKNAYRTADAVVSLLPNALAHMGPRGLSAGRFHWISNGVRAAEWENVGAALPGEHRDAIDALRRCGKLIVVYAGAHGPPNALDQVLDLAAVGSADRPYHFVFIGDGNLKPHLRARVAAEGIDFISFLPRVLRTRPGPPSSSQMPASLAGRTN